MIAFK